MTPDKVKVLYIAGMGRSGSTLLGRLLGELPDTFHVGELGLFWTPQFQSHSRCECRQRVVDCPFWQAVFECAFGGLAALDLKSLQKTRDEYRLWTLPALLLPKTPAQNKRLQDYLAVLGALYAAVQEVSRAKVIVDGSKIPLYGFLLKQVPTVDFYGVHLIRDSRAVAHSYQRVKKDPPLFSNPCQLPRVSPTWTALHWNTLVFLLRSELLSLGDSVTPLLQLRYEDFVADPASTLSRLWNLVGEPAPPLDFLCASPLTLHQGHTVAGNPDRFQSEVKIKPDLEWQRKMSPHDRRLVTALTFPLLTRLGYLHSSPSAAAQPQIQSSRVL